MLRSVFLGCTLWASVASVLIGAESMEDRYTPRASGDAYVTCTIIHFPSMISETIYIPINMGGRCMLTTQSATVGSFQVETLGSDKRFEIHVYHSKTGDEAQSAADGSQSAAIVASVEEEKGKKGEYSLRTLDREEIITISYSFVDQRSREQKREDAGAGEDRERFCVAERCSVPQS